MREEKKGTPATVMVPHEQMTEEIDNVLSDPDTQLSPGAERALRWLRTWTDAPLVLSAAPTTQAATQQEPVAFVSPGQFAQLSDPEDESGKYLPTRKTSAGKFTLALYATPQPAAQQGGTETFQQRVQPWMLECFGAEISADRVERNHRFLEEAMELVQSTGCSASEAHQLVDYVYGRPVGEPAQEVGGVMVTLAALCLANDLDMHVAADVELERIWTKVETIRAKQAAKPKHSPLPAAPVAQGDAEDAERLKEIARAILDYHFALDTRRHGGVAQGKAFAAICQIMGMHWVQGAEAATRAAQKVGA